MKPATATAERAEHRHDDIIYPRAVPFVLVHVAAFAAIWTGITVEAVLICVALYVVRMFGVTAGYHRYFSHRSFRTSRVGQFLLAALAQSSAQRGVLWWAAIHRHHHRHSDTELDVHSPRHHGFFYSHVGWIFADRPEEPDYAAVPDLARYPELVWLNRRPYLMATLLAVAVWFVAGWPGLVVGFFWSTVLLFHGTFMINSLAHVHGRQRYVTGDDSRNNWWLALITLGEGWHNNHHAYQGSTRQGFRWWEIDPTYYVLKILSWLRVVWDLRAPPIEVVKNEQRLGRRIVERVASHIAHSYPVEQLVGAVRRVLDQTPSIDDLRARCHDLATQLPEWPSADALRERARRLYRHLPDVSLDAVVTRANEILAQAVERRLVTEG